MELPPELVAGATLRGNEYAWSVEAFPDALRLAKSLGFACPGGNFQFRLPNAICEMYWLSADAATRRDDEPWSAFVSRTFDEVLEQFQNLLATVDFCAEAKKWPKVPELSGVDARPLDYLCFQAYFNDEEWWDA